MGLRNRIRRLERGDEDERYTLMCPECGERFVVHGRGLHEPAADFLLSVWKKGYQGAPYQDPPEEIRRVAEHAHDASEFIDTATGDPWLGEFFRGVEHEWPSDVPDLSEQAKAERQEGIL